MAALEMLVKIVLALAVVAFIAYPLVRERQEGVEEFEELSAEAEELYRRKESTYSALKELEFDYRTGKLSQSDFEELDTKYRADALEILEAIELYESGGAKTTAPPRPKKPARSAKTAPARSGRAARPAAAGAARAVAVADPEVCTCGYANVEGARFCASCGESLEGMHDEGPEVGERGGSELVCLACGADLGENHRFCAVCGAEAQA